MQCSEYSERRPSCRKLGRWVLRVTGLPSADQPVRRGGGSVRLSSSSSRPAESRAVVVGDKDAYCLHGIGGIWFRADWHISTIPTYCSNSGRATAVNAFVNRNGDCLSVAVLVGEGHLDLDCS